MRPNGENEGMVSAVLGIRQCRGHKYPLGIIPYRVVFGESDSIPNLSE